MIQKIVQYLSQDEIPPEKLVSYESAQLYAWVLIVVTIIFSMGRHYSFLLCFKLGLNVRTALTVLLFKKILRVSKSSNKQTDAGQVLNVLANDLYRFDEVTKSTYGMIVGPILSAVVMYITYSHMGSAFVGALVILITFVPFQGFMGRFFTKFR
jgi:ABC-type transport system involved in cytochrome bd biosynthesis fused ATPase/permease subunit